MNRLISPVMQSYIKERIMKKREKEREREFPDDFLGQTCRCEGHALPDIGLRLNWFLVYISLQILFTVNGDI